MRSLWAGVVAELRLDVDAGRVEGLPVDQHLSGLEVGRQLERAVLARALRVQPVQVNELLRDRVHVPLRLLRHVEAHDLGAVAEEVDRVLQHDLRAHRVLGEVDDHVVPLRRRDRQMLNGHGPFEQPTVVADHVDRGSVVQAQVDEAVHRRAVQDAEPVRAPLDLEARVRGAIHQRDVAGELTGDGQPERVVVVEEAVLDQQRHVVLAAGEIQPLLGPVVEQVVAGQAHVAVERLQAVLVVVVPERRRLLQVRVEVRTGVTGRDLVARQAVRAGRNVPAMQVDREVLVQLVGLLDLDRAVPVDLERRAGELPVVAPDRCLGARQDLGQALPHRDLVVVDAPLAIRALEHRRDPQLLREQLDRG